MSSFDPRSAAQPLDPTKCRIVMVEDEAMVSDILAQALRLRIRPKDVRVFNRGESALAHCMAHPPELLITDLGLPDIDGQELIRRLRAKNGTTRIVVITGRFSHTLPTELISLGVAGYIEKTWMLEESLKTVERVLAGGIHFSAGAPAFGSRPPIPQPVDGPPPEVLTEREREIARSVARGEISKEIADRLGLSPRTVEKARTRILNKLELRDLPALVRWCVLHRLI